MLTLLNKNTLNLVNGGQNTNAKIKSCIIKNVSDFLSDARAISTIAYITKAVKNADNEPFVKVNEASLLFYSFSFRALITFQDILKIKNDAEAQKRLSFIIHSE